MPRSGNEAKTHQPARDTTSNYKRDLLRWFQVVTQGIYGDDGPPIEDNSRLVEVSGFIRNTEEAVWRPQYTPVSV